MTVPFTVLIPARYGSTRLPGKPLVDLNGKPMIAHVARCALDSGASRVFVVTDSNQVAQAAQKEGAHAITFTGEYESGTDRLAAATRMIPMKDDELIINLQGDEPLMPSSVLAALANHYAQSGAPMATVAEIVPRMELHTLSNPNVVKVVTDENDMAMYFSRSLIPFDREQASSRTPELLDQFLRHVGIYAYRANFLREFASWNPTPLEHLEKLEQLRALQKGQRIAVMTTVPLGNISVDTAADAERAAEALKGML